MAVVVVLALGWAASGAGQPSTVPVQGIARRVLNYVRASLPASGVTGQISRVTDTTRGLWMDTGTQWISLTGGVVNAQEFGATANDGTDDTTALQAAITAAAASGGGEVLIPPGTYKITVPLTLASNVWIHGQSKETTILDFSTYTSVNPVITATGTQGTGLTLSANALAGASAVVLTNASTLAAGNMLVLASNAYFKDVTNRTRGETVQVASISGNTVTLENALFDTYNTADVAKVYKVTPVRNIKISDLTVLRLNQTTTAVQGITITYGRSILVENIRMQYCTERGILFMIVVDGWITGNTIEDTWYTATGTSYAVAIGNGSQNIRVTNNYFRKFRHAFTTTMDGSYAAGPARFITVEGNTAEGGQGTTVASFDTHQQSQFVSFVGNTIYITAAFQTGFTIGSYNTVVANNTVYGGGGVEVIAEPAAYAYLNVLVIGNNLYQMAGAAVAGVYISGASGVNIIGNTIQSASAAAEYFGIYVLDPATNRAITDITIANNFITGSIMGIRIDGVHRASIHGNQIRSVGIYGIAVRINGTVVCDRVNIQNNRISSSGTIDTGIYADVGLHTNFVLSGNTIQNATMPMTLQNTTFSAFEVVGAATVADEAYAAGWNASLSVPTKNAVYDKIEALVSVGGAAAGYKIARGSTTLDGSNPTTAASGLATIASCTATFRRTTAPALDPTLVTVNPNGTNLDLYAWKPTGSGDATLIASTDAAVPVDWVCVGT